MPPDCLDEHTLHADGIGWAAHHAQGATNAPVFSQPYLPTAEHEEPVYAPEPAPAERQVAPEPAAEKKEEDIPFYRKVIAQTQQDDPNGYGPNWSNVDDFDIPTVLRKQMD